MNLDQALIYSRGMLNAAGAAMLAAGLIEWFHHQEPISIVLVGLGFICVVFNAVIMYKIRSG